MSRLRIRAKKQHTLTLGGEKISFRPLEYLLVRDDYKVTAHSSITDAMVQVASKKVLITNHKEIMRIYNTRNAYFEIF